MRDFLYRSPDQPVSSLATPCQVLPITDLNLTGNLAAAGGSLIQSAIGAFGLAGLTTGLGALNLAASSAEGRLIRILGDFTAAGRALVQAAATLLLIGLAALVRTLDLTAGGTKRYVLGLGLGFFLTASAEKDDRA